MTEQDNPEQSGNAGDPAKHRATRRAFMVGGTAAAFGAAVAGRAGGQHSITDDQARLLDKVTASATANASLSDVKHIVILMQENRSFDHYFGTLSGVRGFSDPKAAKNANGTPVFDQYGYQPGTGVDAADHAAEQRRRHRRPDRPGLPHPVPRHLPVHRRRLQVLRRPGPYFDAAPH